MRLIALGALVCALIALTGCQVVDCTPGPGKLQACMAQAGNEGLVYAQPGDWGDQVVNNTQRAGTLFVAKPGARFHSLNSHADNVLYSGFDIDAEGDKQLALDLSGSNVGLHNSRVGNVLNEKGAIVSGQDITISHTLFHDVTLDDPAVHLEAIYAIAVDGFTVRDSEFRNIAFADIFFTYPTWWGFFPPPTRDVTLERNFFGRTHKLGGADHFQTVYVADTFTGPAFGSCGNVKGYLTDWVVTDNTFELPTTLLFDCPARHQNFTASGNIGG